jgi:hypothetical protein
MSTKAAAKFPDTPVEQACVDYAIVSDLCADEIEQCIIRTYVRIVFQAMGTDNSRRIVMRLGPVQVHLTEMHPEDTTPGMPPFWIEVFDGTGQHSIDSIGCHEFDEDELAAAVEMILSAAQEAGRRIIPPIHRSAT